MKGTDMRKKILFISFFLTGTLLHADEVSQPTQVEKVSAALTSLGKTREVFSVLKEVLAAEDSAAFDFVENRVLYLGGRKIPSYFCPAPLDRDFCTRVFKATNPSDLKDTLQEWANEHAVSLDKTEDLFVTMKHYFIVAHITFMTAPKLRENAFNEEGFKKLIRVNALLDGHISHLYKLEGV